MPKEGLELFSQLEPDPIGIALGNPFMQFRSPYGIKGLVKIKGNILEILAVQASKPRTGQFRRFLEACKQQFEVITLWEVWNEELKKALARYGFEPMMGVGNDGAIVNGWRWNGL